MHIDSLSIANVGGFGDEGSALDLDRGSSSLAGWTVVAGRNGSGKTSLLRAIALTVLGRSMASWLQHDARDWVRLGADEATVRVGVTAHSVDQFSKKGNRSPRIELARHWGVVGEGAKRVVVTSGREIARGRTRSEEACRGPWAIGSTGWFLAGYGPFRRLSGHAVDAQRAMSGPAAVARTVTLFREDASLIESMQWLRDVHLRALEKDDEAVEMKRIVFALLEDGLLPDPELRVARYDADGLWVTRGEQGIALLLTSLSDGYRSVAALVLDLLRSLVQAFGADHIEVASKARRGEPRVVVPYPGVVLIDEVDAHMHVSWQRRIGPWLKAHFPEIQFIVSTHSPFICQSADENGLILLPEPGSGGPLRLADEALWHRVVNGTADDALLSELFGMERTWSDEAEGKRKELAALELKVLHGIAKVAEKRRFTELRNEIPQSFVDEVESAARRAEVAPKRRAR